MLLPKVFIVVFVVFSFISSLSTSQSEVFASSSSFSDDDDDDDEHYINSQWNAFWLQYTPSSSSEHFLLLYGLVLLSSLQQSLSTETSSKRHLPHPSIAQLVAFMAENGLLPPVPPKNAAEKEEEENSRQQMETALTTALNRFSRYLRHIAHRESSLQFYQTEIKISSRMKRIIFGGGEGDLPEDKDALTFGEVFDRTTAALVQFISSGVSTSGGPNGQLQRRAEMVATVLPRLQELTDYVMTVGGKQDSFFYDLLSTFETSF